MTEENRIFSIKKLQLSFCLALFSSLLFVHLFVLSRAPLDWTFTAGEGFVKWITATESPFSLIEFWYVMAFVIFVIALFAFLGYFIVNFMTKRPEKQQLTKEIVLLVLASIGPFVWLARVKSLLGMFPHFQAEYRIQEQILGTVNLDLHSWFFTPSLLMNELSVSNIIISVIHTISFFILAIHLGYFSIPYRNKILKFSIMKKILSKIEYQGSIQSLHTNQTYVKKIMMMFCSSFFSAFFLMHLVNVNLPLFSWFEASVKSIFLLNQNIILINILEFWYLLAFFIYVSTSVGIFTIFLVIFSRQKSVGNTKLAMATEFTLIVVIAMSSFFGLHLARIVLVTLPIIDPEYDRQLSYLEKNNIQPNQWTYQSIALEERAYNLMLYSITVWLFPYMSILVGVSIFLIILKKIRNQKFFTV